MGRNVKDKEARSVVGYLPENPYFYDYLTAEEPCDRQQHLRPILRPYQGKDRALLEKVNLPRARKRQLRTYSKGMVQRANGPCPLIHDPEVVILDEPMSGLDPIGRKMVGDLLVELKQQGKTIFSHPIFLPMWRGSATGSGSSSTESCAWWTR